MRRRLTRALGVLALGWLACPALSADPVNDAPAAAPTAVVPQELPPQNDPTPVLAASTASGGEAQGGGGHFFAGAGVYILKPFIERDRAWDKSIGVGLPVPPGSKDFLNEQVTDFTYDFKAAPRVWLGWVSQCGWGARARYFHFDINGAAPPGTLSTSDFAANDALHPADPLGNRALDPETTFLNPPGGGASVGTDVLTVSSRLKLDVYDLEAIDEIRTGAWLFTIGAGARHADLVQFYDAIRFNTQDLAGVDTRTLRSSHRFTGTGPMFALDVRRPIGDTGLAVYGNARGGCLFGDRRQIAYATQAGGFNLADNVLQKQDAVPVTETEIGMEWSRDFSAVRPFVQVGVVGQGWFNALTNDASGSEPPVIQASSNGLLGFLGFSITAGVNF